MDVCVPLCGAWKAADWGQDVPGGTLGFSPQSPARQCPVPELHGFCGGGERGRRRPGASGCAGNRIRWGAVRWNLQLILYESCGPA